MNAINRSLLVVLAKQPYAQWANSTKGPTLSLEEHRELATAYLVPEIESDKQKARILKDHFELIFENELSAWSLDKTEWPMINYSKFQDWFEIQVFELVLDAADSQLELE